MQHNMQFIAWNNRKIWKPKQYKITVTLPPRNILQLQLRVNSINEYFMETDLHLQISQQQGRLKHENFTVSYHSYLTQLPQNILQLQLHFSCALYTINNLRFTKIRVSWNGELPLHVPNFKMFLTLPKFQWSCFSWSNLIWTVVICSNI